jgi:hypothetical protein
MVEENARPLRVAREEVGYLKLNDDPTTSDHHDDGNSLNESYVIIPSPEQ